jgi:hypothetical protein
MSNTMARAWTPIAAVLAAALLLRLGVPLLAWAVSTPGPQFREPDSESYIRLAQQFLETGSLGTPERPEIVRTPGYPFLLLPGSALGHIEAVTIGLQAVLGCAMVFFVYRASLVVFGEAQGALVAALLAACEPVSIIYSSKLLTESSFATFMAAELWLLARYSVRRRTADLLIGAIVMAASCYLRPIAYFLPAWSGVAMLVVLWRSESNCRRLVLHAASFVAVAMGLILPWQMRNYVTAGYSGFAAISDINLYYYEALPVLADQRRIGPEDRDQLRIEEGEGSEERYLMKHPQQRDWPQAARYRFLRQEAMRIIRSDPLRWAWLHFAGMFQMLTDSGRNGWLAFFRLADTSKPVRALPSRTFWDRLTNAIEQKPLVLAIHGLLAAVLAAYWGLAAIGLVSPAARQPATLLVLAVALYLVLLSGGDAAYHRFRVPLLPAICFFAGQGYVLLVRRWRGRHA